MQNNMDFVIENVRFGINSKQELLFTGWFRDDNPDKRLIMVELDGKALHYSLVNHKGLEVIQKYLHRDAGVTEEIRGKLTLPEKWRDKENLVFYSVGDEKKEVCRVSTSRLVKMCDELQCNIDNFAKTNQLIISGWVASKEEVSFELKNKNQIVPITVSRYKRKDVNSVYEELDESYEAGFRIEADIKKYSKLELVLTSGRQTKCCSLNIAATSNNQIVKGLRFLKNNGPKATAYKVYSKLSGKSYLGSINSTQAYAQWRKKYEITKEAIEQQRSISFDYNPLISVVIPMYKTNPDYLRELLESYSNQTYKNLEVCLADGSEDNSNHIKVVEEFMNKDSRFHYKLLNSNEGISQNTNAAIEMAQGEYILFSDHDDIVPLNAIFEFVSEINNDCSIDVLYSDEDKVDMKGKVFFEPHFKSDYNIDLLCSMNYICHLFMVKKSLIDVVGVLRPEFDGAQDYDFILRCCEKAENIKHIPKILYHWRCHMDSTASNPESKLYAFEAGRRAVEEHYRRCGIPATVENGDFYGLYKTKYHWGNRPLVSIIIPNKDHIDDLKKCMDAIDSKSSYKNYEFVVVENNSTEAETFEFYKSIENRENITIAYYEGDFNFSKINNFGVTFAKGQYYLLLNNDTEIINPDCISEMLDYCMRDDVGIVGARLYYNDGTIQHAGVVIGFGGIAGHTFIGASRYENGYFSRTICAQDYSAVTAACMMTKKEVYEKVHGLSEEYKVAFNDIDYCMKVRKLGLLVVYNPAAELYHYESKSRGMEDTPEKVQRFNSEVARFISDWGEELKKGDPYYNKNLSLNRSDFGLKE